MDKLDSLKPPEGNSRVVRFQVRWTIAVQLASLLEAPMVRGTSSNDHFVWTNSLGYHFQFVNYISMLNFCTSGSMSMTFAASGVGDYCSSADVFFWMLLFRQYWLNGASGLCLFSPDIAGDRQQCSPEPKVRDLRALPNICLSLIEQLPLTSVILPCSSRIPASKGYDLV